LTTTLETVEFESKALGRTAKMKVLAPRDDSRRYPVLYMQHGLGDTHDTFFWRTKLQQYAADLEMIIVTPDAGKSWFCNDTRPDGLAWEDHIASEAVDFVDANFATIAGRRGRGLAGFSMGGYGAMMVAFRHADRFAAVCTQAGSFAFGHELRDDRPQRSEFMMAVAPPGGKYDLFVLADVLAAEKSDLAIRFDVGTSDHLIDANRKFHTQLERAGIPHEYEEVDGGHQWVYVDRQLPKTLAFIAGHLAKAES
jgi:S-formylglutathione hydrolase FrmB